MLLGGVQSKKEHALENDRLAPGTVHDDLTPTEAILWILRQGWLIEEVDVGGLWVVFGCRKIEGPD